MCFLPLVFRREALFSARFPRRPANKRFTCKSYLRPPTHLSFWLSLAETSHDCELASTDSLDPLSFISSLFPCSLVALSILSRSKSEAPCLHFQKRSQSAGKKKYPANSMAFVEAVLPINFGPMSALFGDSPLYERHNGNPNRANVKFNCSQ